MIAAPNHLPIILRKVIAVEVVLLLALAAGCRVESYEPKYEATVVIQTARYHVLAEKLDAELAKFGLTRFKGSEAMRNLYKERFDRDVMHFAYMTKADDTVPFLNAADFQKVGMMRVSVFPEALPEPKGREAISRVDVVLADFGTKLEPFKRTELKAGSAR